MNYSIIDIETTGGNPFRDRITEIAIFVHNGDKVTREFHTLINPERKIPYFISKMTGITDEMVAHAPKFYEIAKKIVELTENTIFVAHNASFDYNFIKTEFKNLGYFYQRDILCTVKLCRKIIPGKKSYSLGNLCNDLGISISNRHRAIGDALATVKLFDLLLRKNAGDIFAQTLNLQFNNNMVNPAITRQIIDELPQKTGIYYFLNEKTEIIYVGKSRDIKQRVISHLSGAKTKKAAEMIEKISEIHFEITGSELIALLRESEEIKNHNPVFNKAKKNSSYNYGLFSFLDEKGYLCTKIDKFTNGQLPHTCFSSHEKGKEFLFILTEKYHLCQNLTGLYATSSGCFQYALKRCHGACVGEESPEVYNKRVAEALEYAGYVKENLIVLDNGRTPSESSFIMLENGKYLGYGFAERSQTLENPNDFKDLLIPAHDNRDARLIISGFLRNKRTGKRIVYKNDY